MPVQMQCPHCHKPLTVSQEQLGRSLGCPHCRTSFRVQAGKASQASVGPASEAVPEKDKNALPTHIGRYEIRRKLGEGAFGLVLQGFDASLERNVAIKVLRPEKLMQKPGALGTAAAVQRFLREARAVAQLLHGNIIPVFELGEHEGAPFIVSAFIPGRTLAALLAEHSNGLEPARAVRLIVQLLEALSHAHEQNIVHRDVKPDNAMVDAADKLYLMDFGLAGWVEQQESRMTQAGTVMGTPHYMPPEQAGGEIELVGPAADQYSAGVALYELLTGNLPFPGGPNLTVLLAQILRATPTPLRDWRPDLDPQLEALCLKALAKDPAERYASCRQFADSLRRWLDTRSDNPPLLVEPIQRGSRRAPGAGRSTVGGLVAKQPTLAADPELLPVQVTEAMPSSKPPWFLLTLAAVALLLIGGATFAILSSLRPEQKAPPPREPKKTLSKQLNE